MYLRKLKSEVKISFMSLEFESFSSMNHSILDHAQNQVEILASKISHCGLDVSAPSKTHVEMWLPCGRAEGVRGLGLEMH
jgi:hypothetical protein